MGDADKYTSAKSLLFEMEHTPFTRDIPPELLYESPYVTDAIGLLAYAADRQLNADGKAKHGRKSACPHDNSDRV